MNRRKFCILTTATGLGAICGWILPLSRPETTPSRNLPKMRKDIRLDGNQMLLQNQTIGEIDDLALAILKLLDGTNSIPTIATKISTTSQTITAANVAMFCLFLKESNLIGNDLNLEVFSQEYQT